MNSSRIAGLAAVLTLLLLPCHAGAQEPGKGEEMTRRRPERLERYRKMRLIETLKLNEEDAVRFFSKQSAHEDAQRETKRSRQGTVLAAHDRRPGALWIVRPRVLRT